MTLRASIRDAATVTRYELRMQLRRPALWLTTILVFGFITYRLVDTGGKGGPPPATVAWADVVREAAHHSVLINMLFPVAAGLLLADRLSRDRILRTGEVLDSVGMPAAARLWGKLAGGGGAVVLVCLCYSLIASGYTAVVQDDPSALPAGMLAFLAIGLPALAFVAAFSIVGGDLLGRAPYLALFIGYWFWGNIVDPHVVPSLSCTLLSPVRGNVSSGLFGGTALYAGSCDQQPVDPTVTDAIASELILILATTAAMLAGTVLLNRRRATR